jgi:type II secretory pathway component PulF
MMLRRFFHEISQLDNFFWARVAMNEQISDRKESPVVLGGWLVVVVIALAAAVGQSFGRFSFGVLLPAIRDDLAITNTLVGLIGAANVGAYLLGTMIVAWATARYRLLQVMRWGLILAVLGLLIARCHQQRFGSGYRIICSWHWRCVLVDSCAGNCRRCGVC